MYVYNNTAQYGYWLLKCVFYVFIKFRSCNAKKESLFFLSLRHFLVRHHDAILKEKECSDKIQIKLKKVKKV